MFHLRIFPTNSFSTYMMCFCLGYKLGSKLDIVYREEIVSQWMIMANKQALLLRVIIRIRPLNSDLEDHRSLPVVSGI